MDDICYLENICNTEQQLYLLNMPINSQLKMNLTSMEVLKLSTYKLVLKLGIILNE